MNKKALTTLFIILGLTAVGCRPAGGNSSEESSSVVSSSEESSEDISSSSSSESSSSEVIHTHTPKTEWNHDNNTHWHDCVANDGAKLNEAVHVFESRVVTDATYDASGIKRYTCSTCGYYYDEVIPQLVHKYSSEWSHDNAKHWHACTDDGFENLKKDEEDHSFTSSVITEATYEAAGTRRYTCSTCGYYYDEVIPQLVHNYSSDWTTNATHHWHACNDDGFEELKDGEAEHIFVKKDVVEPTSTEYGYTNYECSTCGYEKKDDYVDPIAEHHYSSDWSHDNAKHWHACTDEGCDAKADVANHDFEPDVVEEATYDETGIRRYTCSTCGYYYDEVIPQLVHQYSPDWSHDNAKHWHACIDDGFEELKKDEGNHSFNATTIIEATHDHTGLKRYTCETCNYYYEEEIPQVAHEFSSSWTYDDKQHWHVCTGCDATTEKVDHSFGEPVLTPSENPDYKKYIKGINTYSCTDCGYSYQENALYTKQEVCDLMNAYIAGKDNYFDIFEMRTDLDSIYPVEDFGYDMANNQVVIYNNQDNIISFKSALVSTFAELVEAIRKVSENEANFSVIKLANDLTINENVLIHSSNPIAIDLNEHTLKSTQEKDGIIKIARHGTQASPIVAIYNGTIETKEISTAVDGYDLSKSPSCVAVTDATAVRISNVYLNNKAERGYGYIDYPKANGNAAVKINDCVIDSKIVAICIQTNNNTVYNNTISGNIIINGGNTSIRKNVITARIVEDGFVGNVDSLVESVDVFGYAKAYIHDENMDTYMFTATDAILILDRRSELSTYSLPAVAIHDNTLTCVASSTGTPYGYGVRYIDLNLDSNKAENAFDAHQIEIGDQRTSDTDENGNTYTYYSGSLMSAGGVDLYYIHEVQQG